MSRRVVLVVTALVGLLAFVVIYLGDFLLLLLIALVALLLSLAARVNFFQDVVLVEILYFQFHGEGRPPCSKSKAPATGLSYGIGRMCSCPVPA